MEVDLFEKGGFGCSNLLVPLFLFRFDYFLGGLFTFREVEFFKLLWLRSCTIHCFDDFDRYKSCKIHSLFQMDGNSNSLEWGMDQNPTTVSVLGTGRKW